MLHKLKSYKIYSIYIIFYFKFLMIEFLMSSSYEFMMKLKYYIFYMLKNIYLK